jgi:hypothetical protein
MHAGCGALCIRMRERAYNCLPSAYFRDGAHEPYSTNDCQYSPATRRKLKLETAYHPQREISRMRANPTCVRKPHDNKAQIRIQYKLHSKNHRENESAEERKFCPPFNIVDVMLYVNYLW